MTEYDFIDTSTAESNETNEATESVESDGPEQGEISENGLHAYCEECESWVTAANLHTHAPCYQEKRETEDNRGFLGRGFSTIKNILGR